MNMTLSGLIALLQGLQEKHGDVFVETVETSCSCGNAVTDSGPVEEKHVRLIWDERGVVVAVAFDPINP
jgi:hypothetical protein